MTTAATGGPHTDALRLLRGWAAPSAAQEALRREYVAHLESHPDALSRTCWPDHLTASTLVLAPDEDSVLLHLHAKAGAWFQLGGHLEPGDATLLAGAQRELIEESGLTGLRTDPVPVHLDIHPVAYCGGAGTRHLDVRFLATADPSHVVEASEESLAVRWWPLDALPPVDASLCELIRRGRERLLS